MKWVGRAIRRLEDPALVRGRGRFTADFAAAHFVRLVRSPVAAGRIVKIMAPETQNWCDFPNFEPTLVKDSYVSIIATH